MPTEAAVVCGRPHDRKRICRPHERWHSFSPRCDMGICPPSAYVGSVPARAEEFLFRFALLPAISPDWRGAIISGLVFGALHVNGGRNVAFAAWASAVGTSYGYLYLYTGSLAASAAAHALANVLSALLWTANHDDDVK